MLNALFEGIKIIAQVFWNFGVMMLKTIYELSGIPTSQYRLVKFIAENNIVIFNSAIFTKIIMFITPLIVSHIVVYLTSLVGIKSFKVKEELSIFLYLIILYLFSSWIFWLVIGSVVLIFVVSFILNYVNNQKVMN